jgi:hypothetical protein
LASDTMVSMFGAGTNTGLTKFTRLVNRREILLILSELLAAGR